MMTRTEERLKDALAARADAVREEALRPLVTRPGRRGAGMWRGLAPLAAATSVALVAALIAVLSPGDRTHEAGGGLPRYYVWYADTHANVVHLQVRSAATGAAVSAVPDPALAGGAGWEWFGAVAGFRAYVALAACPGCQRSRLYSFRLDQSGHVIKMAVKVGPTVPVGAGGYSLSPDGSRLAYLTMTSLHGTQTPAIHILNLRTGKTAIWRGGLDRGREVPVIYTLSWPRDGSLLAFAATWCHRPAMPGRPTCSPWTVRSLNPGGNGGALKSGSILLTTRTPARYQALTAPVINPAGTAVLQLSYGAAADTFAPVVQLTSTSLSTGKRTVLHTWIGKVTRALLTTGGVAVLVSTPEQAGTSSHGFQITGLVDRSGRYQPFPSRGGSPGNQDASHRTQPTMPRTAGLTRLRAARGAPHRTR